MQLEPRAFRLRDIGARPSASLISDPSVPKRVWDQDVGGSNPLAPTTAAEVNIASPTMSVGRWYVAESTAGQEREDPPGRPPTSGWASYFEATSTATAHASLGQGSGGLGPGPKSAIATPAETSIKAKTSQSFRIGTS